MEIITFTNLKGGSGKTTSTAFVAHAYAAQGLNVLIVDADPQGSCLDWSEQGEWAIPTISLPVKNLHTRLEGIVSPDTDIVLIDTPPLDDEAGIVYSALRAADKIVVTMAPTMMEFGRLGKVWAAIEDVGALRAAEPAVAVLFNRTSYNANSTPMFRGLIEDSGHAVLPSTIARLEIFAQAFGGPITDLGKYVQVALEITQLGVEK